MEKLNDYIDFCSDVQRPERVFGHGRCSPATSLYLVLAAFGASTAETGAFVAETVCALAGFLAFFLDFLAAGVVALVEVFFISAVASDLAAIGAVAAGAGAAAGVAAGALAGAAGAVVAGAVVCAAAVSDTANAPASSALNNLVMAISSV
jgi:hypothetical protein